MAAPAGRLASNTSSLPAFFTNPGEPAPICSCLHSSSSEGLVTQPPTAHRSSDATLHFEGSTVDVAPTGLAVVSDEHSESQVVDDVRRIDCLNDIAQAPK